MAAGDEPIAITLEIRRSLDVLQKQIAPSDPKYSVAVRQSIVTLQSQFIRLQRALQGPAPNFVVGSAGAVQITQYPPYIFYPR
jgi:hypothetical protein